MFKPFKIIGMLLIITFLSLTSCNNEQIESKIKEFSVSNENVESNTEEAIEDNENSSAAENDNSKQDSSSADNLVITDEDKLDHIESELNKLINTINALKDSSDMVKEFENYMNDSELEVVHLYFANVDGETFLEPFSELPQDYDPRERPFYINAVKDGIFIPEQYNDFMTNRLIQTIAKPMYVNNEIIGVIGMDVYYDAVVMPEEMPDDFEITFTYGVEQANQHSGIDSRENTVQKDLVQNGLAITDIEIGESLLKEMYQTLRVVNVTSYPSVYKPDYTDNPEEGVVVEITPSMVYDMRISFNGIRYSLYWHNKNGSTASEAVVLEEAFSDIIGLITQTEEYKQLEDSVGGYD